MDVLMTAVRYPPAPGGAETHAYEVTKRLLRRGHRVEVFTSDLYKEIPFQRMPKVGEDLDNGSGWGNGQKIKRFRAYSLGGELHYVLIPSMVPAMLRYDCDIVHAHSYGYFQVNSAALKRILQPDVRFVLTPHFHPPWSMWGGDRRRRVRGWYDRFFAPRVLDAVDRIIGVSSHEMELMSRLGFDPDKVRVIPNGIDTSLYSPIPDGGKFMREFGLEKGRKRYVLYTGRLASNKGLHYLVDAAQRVLSSCDDVFFLLVGEDAGEKEALEKRIRDKGLEASFLLTGHIKDDSVFRSAYGAADVFVLPSEYEAFGIVLLEAMACKVPVVATTVGGVPDVVDKDSGFLVPYGDSEALAERISRLLDDPALARKMGEKGRKRAMDNFGWNVVVDALEKVYRELV